MLAPYLHPTAQTTVQVETCIVCLSGVRVPDTQMYEGLHPIDWSDADSIKRALLVGALPSSQSARHRFRSRAELLAA